MSHRAYVFLVIFGSGLLRFPIEANAIRSPRGYSSPWTATYNTENVQVAGRASEEHSPNAPESEGVRLLSDEPGEASRGVAGTVCDNLRGMPDAKRNHLVVELPERWRKATVTGLSLCEWVYRREDKKDAPARNEVNVGTLRWRDGKIIYFPPDEFNRNPEPTRIAEVTKDRQRSILLTVSVSQPGGRESRTFNKTVVLLRPPAILIHGIDSSAALWKFSSEFGWPLATKLNTFGFTLDLFDHGGSDSASAQGRLEYYGNGPVEYAAELLERQVRARLQATRQRSPSFSIRRVDLVAHSYGGVIARWYLRMFSRNSANADSRRWYAYAANNNPQDGLYRLNETWFNSPPYKPELPDPCVRKLITIASPWRGTPIANYLNQMRVKCDPLHLHTAPILFNRHFTVGMVADRLLVDSRLPAQLHTKVPSTEVTAIDSPWLRYLNGFVEDGKVKPFLDDVAYGTLAGDNTAFLDLSAREVRGSRGFRDFIVDIYTLLDAAQLPSHFPYLALERRTASAANYSDGLIPLWSALQPGGVIIGANHDSILTNPRAIEQVMCWLSSAALPNGTEMNARWDEPIESRVIDDTGGQKKRWTFVPGSMAPYPESDIYGLVDGTGRIKPNVYPDLRDVVITPRADGATVSWTTPLNMEGWLTLYERRLIDFARYDFVEVGVISSNCLGKVHSVSVTGLDAQATYVIKVISDYTDPLDGVLELQSEVMPLTPGRN